MAIKSRQASRGFTLPEVLITMALIAVISLVVMGSLEPWIGFKQKLDTERRLQDVKNGLSSVYDGNAMAVESQAANRFMDFITSTPVAGPDGAIRCESQVAAFQKHTEVFSESPSQVSQDGYANPWCFMISAPLSETRDGVPLWYRNVAVVSTGANGSLEAGTQMAADGTLTVDGDDLAVTITGREIQAAKLRETLRRLNRVAQFYESYFTARYLSYADRDITRYYFADGPVVSTADAWTPSRLLLAPVGLGGAETVTPWEARNDIEVNNFNQTINGVTVRSPATSGTGVLPYTALLRARVPAPSGVDAFAVQTAVGNY